MSNKRISQDRTEKDLLIYVVTRGEEYDKKNIEQSENNKWPDAG